jgi:hypothetical protein
MNIEVALVGSVEGRCPYTALAKFSTGSLLPVKNCVWTITAQSAASYVGFFLRPIPPPEIQNIQIPKVEKKTRGFTV